MKVRGFDYHDDVVMWLLILLKNPKKKSPLSTMEAGGFGLTG